MKKYLHLLMACVAILLAIPAHASKTSISSHYNQEIGCMGQAIFYEAAGETYRGQVAVGNVILNRMNSGIYPKTVCGVIQERGQFQWFSNRKLRKNRVYHATKRDKHIHKLAKKLYSQHTSGTYRAGKHADVTGGALFFSSNGVRPAKRAVKGVKIGRHQFFTLRGFKYKHRNRA